MKFKIAVISTFMRQVGVLALGFFAVAYSSRTVGSSEFGMYALAMSLVVISTAIFSFGMPSAIVHFFKKMEDAGDKGVLIGEGLGCLVASLILPPVLYFFLHVANLRLWSDSLEIGRIEIFCYYCVTSINTFLSSFLLAERKYVFYNKVQLVPSILMVPLLFFFLQEGDGWVDLVRFGSISYLVATPFYLSHFRRHLHGMKITFPINIDFSRFYYAANLWGANLVTTFFYRAPYIYIEAVAGAKMLGAYALAMQFAEKVWIPGRSIAAIVFPERSATSLSERKAGLDGAYKLIFLNMALVLFGMVVIYFAFDNYSRLLFGPEYAEATDMLLGLIPGVVVWGGVIVIGAELAGRGYSGKNLLASMYALIACLVGMLVGQAWGGLGIAVGVSFGYLIGFVASMSYFHFLMK